MLITARDPASANDIFTILPDLLNSKKFKVKIVAQNPAYTIIKNKFTNHFKSELLLVEFNVTINESIDIVSSIFDNFKPQFLLTGISGPVDYGVDEIALKTAYMYDNAGYKINTFSIQSYWGDLNKNLGVLAETIFVLDKFAKRATLEKCNKCNVVVTGPLQVKKYSNLDIMHKRDTIRKKLNNDEVKIIGFFGQPLFEYEWYKETIEKFFKALVGLHLPFRILYKPHPKETCESIRWTIKRIENIQNNFILVNKLDILDVLPATDLVVSLFSTAGYDLQNILAQSPIAFSTPMYLFHEQGCREWFKEYCQLDEIPMSHDDMALVVTQSSELPLVINQGLDKEVQFRCYQSIKNNLPFGDESAVDIVLDTIDHVIPPKNQTI